MNIDMFLPKRGILNPHINHISSLHYQETQAVTVLTFKRFRVTVSGVRDLSPYVYNFRCSFMVSLDTLRSWGIL